MLRERISEYWETKVRSKHEPQHLPQLLKKYGMLEEEQAAARPAAAPPPSAAGGEAKGAVKEEELAMTPVNVKGMIAPVPPRGKEVSSVEEARDALVWSLGKLPVSLFPQVPEVYEISSTASLAEALRLLERHNLRSLPVRNVENPDSEDWAERYLGVVDYAGIILWVFSALGSGDVPMEAKGVRGMEAAHAASDSLLGLASATAAALWGQPPDEESQMPYQQPPSGPAAGMEAARPSGRMQEEAEQFREQLLNSSVFQDNKVGQVAGFFRFTPFLPVDPNESVLSLLLLMSKQRLRVAPVIAPRAKDLANVVTQMGVIDFLRSCDGMPWFDAIADQPLYQLGLPCHPPNKVIKVHEEELVMEPFRLMVEYDIGGIPVVDKPDSMHVVANVSTSDILHLLHLPRLLASQDASRLTVRQLIDAAQPVLGSQRRESIWPVMRPAASCTRNTSLRAVIHALHRLRIHRLYVVQGEGEAAAKGGGRAGDLLGVVTLRDIIAMFVSGKEEAGPGARPEEWLGA